MKNKVKLIVTLAVLLTLALLALTGCTTTIRDYKLDDIGLITISDAIEDSLESCVVVEVMQSGQTYYYSVGVAVNENTIICPKQTMPANSLSTTNHFLPSNLYSIKGRLYEKTGRFNLEYSKSINSLLEYDAAFWVFKVADSNVKLTPVKFAQTKENNDIIALGEMLFGVEILLPSYKVWEDTARENIPTSEYLKVISAMVSSKSMQIGTYGPSQLKDVLKEISFTTQGYFNKSDYDTYMSGWNVLHYYSSLGNVSNYALTNNMLFNKNGEFVGLNYLKRVDEGEKNGQVVIGIGYACKSNSIKTILESVGVEVTI